METVREDRDAIQKDKIISFLLVLPSIIDIAILCKALSVGRTGLAQ
jgi:hypothetical protein